MVTFKLTNIFGINCKMYLSQMFKCICGWMAHGHLHNIGPLVADRTNLYVSWHTVRKGLLEYPLRSHIFRNNPCLTFLMSPSIYFLIMSSYACSCLCPCHWRLSPRSCLFPLSLSWIQATDPAVQDWCGLRGLPLTCLWLGGKSGGNERELLGSAQKWIAAPPTDLLLQSHQLTTEARPFWWSSLQYIDVNILSCRVKNIDTNVTNVITVINANKMKGTNIPWCYRTIFLQ